VSRRPAGHNHDQIHKDMEQSTERHGPMATQEKRSLAARVRAIQIRWFSGCATNPLVFWSDKPGRVCECVCICFWAWYVWCGWCLVYICSYSVARRSISQKSSLFEKEWSSDVSLMYIHIYRRDINKAVTKTSLRYYNIWIKLATYLA
jgi:hypothetical protein